MQRGASQVNLAFIAMIVAVATIGGFMFGYDSGVINGTQEGLEKAFNLSKLGTGFNVGAILIGCSIGAFAAGRLSDRLGRRGVMRISAILFLISALIAGAAPGSELFVLARLLGGFGVGAASVLSPVYISEVTPASIRGRLSSIQQIMIITGLTGAFIANYVLAQAAGGSQAILWGGYPAWRWMFWMQAIPALVYFLALLFIPESPRFLVVRGREGEARAVLTKLFGPEAAAAKVAEIRSTLVADHRPKFSDLKDQTTGKVRPIIWAGMMLAVFQQFVGINIVFYYGAVLWQAVGFSENDALLTNIISGVVSIAACILTVLLVDKVGRKPLLLIGSAGMTVTLGLMAYAFSQGVFDASGALQLPGGLGRVAFISALGYSALFNLSWGPIMWVMLGEMFPNQIRGSALAVCGFAQWIANFIISVSFPWLLVNVGLAPTYSFYALSAFVSFFLVRKLLHETRGRELEQMEG
ncbi:sugar porter family MFS transporter [uncultured Sphingomonas sp.]|uniref:sugar porter family MFS transporter n=1 Tax=uncultured Sphingomonas sp. TaxID=158754 RepID=UPI0025F4AE7F|nr:sugar porter family MFS transporter [uncultured Sphingomonas sp.]